MIFNRRLSGSETPYVIQYQRQRKRLHGVRQHGKRKAISYALRLAKTILGCMYGKTQFLFFEKRLKGVETDNGVIRLKLDQEIPFSLISEIAKWCFTMDQMK